MSILVHIRVEFISFKVANIHVKGGELPIRQGSGGHTIGLFVTLMWGPTANQLKPDVLSLLHFAFSSDVFILLNKNFNK